MDINDLSNAQLRLLIFFLGFVVVCLFCLFAGSLLAYVNKSNRSRTPGDVVDSKGLNPDRALMGNFINHQGDEMMNEKKGRRKGLLKSSGPQFQSNPQPVHDRPIPSLAQANTHELFRVLVDLTTQEIIVAVESEQFRRINQVKDRAIGQRILEGVALLLQFTGGLIATTSGLKTLPKPAAKLSLSLIPQRPGLNPAKSLSQITKPEPSSNKPQRDPEPNPTSSNQPLSLSQRLQQNRAASLDGNRGDEQVAFPKDPLERSPASPIKPRRPISLRPSDKPPETQPPIQRGLFGFNRGGSPMEQNLTFNLADEIDRIVQQKLAALQNPTPVIISSGPGGQVDIRVADRLYTSVEDVEDEQIRALIQEAIQEWQS